MAREMTPDMLRRLPFYRRWRIDQARAFRAAPDRWRVERQQQENEARSRMAGASLDEVDPLAKFQPATRAVLETLPLAPHVTARKVIERHLRSDEVIAAVLRHTGVTHADLCGSSRHPLIVLSRQLLCLMLRKHLGLSYPTIAAVMGKKSHGTTIDAYRRCESRIADGVMAPAPLNCTVAALAEQIDATLGNVAASLVTVRRPYFPAARAGGLAAAVVLCVWSSDKEPRK